MVENKWTLNLGCHRDTLMSRDCRNEKCDSLEECRQIVKEAEEGWRKIGYYVWYAYAVPPGGTLADQIKLHPGTPYS